jgi:hypothetical protein
MRILFDDPVSRAVKKEITAQMVNKSLKKGEIRKKLNPADCYSQPQYSKIKLFFNILTNSWSAIENFSPVKKLFFYEPR